MKGAFSLNNLLVGTVRTPDSKMLLVCSVVDFCAGKSEQRHARGVENVPYEGGPKPLFSEGFSPPPFPTPPPMASSEKGLSQFRLRSGGRRVALEGCLAAIVSPLTV